MSPEPGGAVPDRTAVLELIACHVHVRFSLNAEAYADRLLELAQASDAAAGSPQVWIERLRLDDLYLASACARSDERAWEECATRHFGFVRDFARRRLRGTQAEEVADQVIADLWRRGKIGRFEGRSSLRTWLGAVVAHAALNAAKAERSSSRLDGEAGFGASRPQAPPSGEASEVEKRTAGLVAGLVVQAMGALTDDDRLLVLMYYEQELTLDQIAAVSGGSKASLSRRLKRLREGLRADVERLAQQTLAAGVDRLRSGLDLSRVPFDLARALSRSRVEGGRGEAV